MRCSVGTYLRHMLTRLEVHGFKNLVDVDVRFGPFTCIAGGNGVGKSNLFDAIRFLGALGDLPLNEAAGLVRDEGGGGDLQSLFTKVGEERLEQMRFAAEVIIQAEGVDDLRQAARATATYLRYELHLGFREADAELPERLVLEHESLIPLKIGDLRRQLPFRYNDIWRRSAVIPKVGTINPLLATVQQEKGIIIKRHQERKGGKPREFYAEDVPRTVLSSTSAVEGPTALLVRQELRSWRLLQLEPSALRKPSNYRDSNRLGSDGSSLAATLRRLILSEGEDEGGSTLQLISNRLNDLLRNVRHVRLVDDPVRQTYSLAVRDRSDTLHDTRSLSDGTLRFLALSVLANDPKESGVICLEEPENGIHPERIPAIIELLRDIAVDPGLALDVDNPPRQVIVNTHSPAVVQQVPFESLLIAQTGPIVRTGGSARGGVRYLPPPNSLREKRGDPSFPLTSLLPYVSPVADAPAATSEPGALHRVIDSPVVAQLRLFDMV